MRFLADEHINLAIARDLLREEPDLDIVELRQAALLGAPDPEVLEWAAREGCVLVTRDMGTVPDYAFARVAAGLPMPGVFVLRHKAPIGEVTEDLLLIARASQAEKWAKQVIYVPLA
jgi:predicted nuclease of predicted toxin-antitoxin system